jgi:hypothetical protein
MKTFPDPLLKMNDPSPEFLKQAADQSTAADKERRQQNRAALDSLPQRGDADSWEKAKRAIWDQPEVPIKEFILQVEQLLGQQEQE